MKRFSVLLMLVADGEADAAFVRKPYTDGSGCEETV